MKWRRFVTVSSVVGIAFVLAAGCGLISCDPNLPLSDKNGTDQIFTASEKEVILAITSAYGDSRKSKMILQLAAEMGADWFHDWHPTNGFILFTFHDPIAFVPVFTMVGTKQLPYIPYFYVIVKPLNSNQTQVVVRTVRSEVIDGKESGVHGGWANHYRKVSPVRREEKHILEAISEQLLLPKNPN